MARGSRRSVSLRVVVEQKVSGAVLKKKRETAEQQQQQQQQQKCSYLYTYSNK